MAGGGAGRSLEAVEQKGACTQSVQLAGRGVQEQLTRLAQGLAHAILISKARSNQAQAVQVVIAAAHSYPDCVSISCAAAHRRGCKHI